MSLIKPVALMRKRNVVNNDPLADITGSFSMRFQTKFQGTTPFQLFTDTSSLTPANVGDNVGSWKDTLSPSGLKYSQATTLNQAVVGQSGNAIYITTNSTNTAYTAIGSASLPYAISVLERPNIAGLRTIDSGTTNALISTSRTDVPFFLGSPVSTTHITPDGQFHIGTLLCNSTGTAQAFLDGVDVTTGSVGVTDFGSLAICRGGASHEGVDTDIAAIFVYPPIHRARVEAYLLTLVA